MITKLMRKIFPAGIVILALTTATPWAADTRADLKAASEAMEYQKRKYIEQVMELAPEEADAFWRIYAAYEAGLAPIKKRRVALAATFLANHSELSDADALDMLDQKLKIDSDELEFKRSYVTKFMQALPGRRVLRLYQTENRFDTAATAELYRNIPVIR